MTSLSELYFRPKAAELDGRVYEWLGVLWFKRALMSQVTVDPSKPAQNAYVLPGRSREDLRAFERKTRRSELIHLLGLVLAVLMLGMAAWPGTLALGVAGIVVFAANFHCFILQRYNRIRICRVLDRRRANTLNERIRQDRA